MPEDLQNFEYQRSWVIGEDPETAFPTLNYLKNWKSNSDFITYQPSETQVRADMQELFDEIKAYLNGDFKAYVVATGNAENIRVENEAARVANEQARVNNEQTRIANEETRITNETTRQTQEQARQDAEAARASENDGIVARATAQANTATEKATVATEQASIAAEKAAVATEKATVATEQASIAAEKAAVATEKAAEAAASASSASAASGLPSGGVPGQVLTRTETGSAWRVPPGGESITVDSALSDTSTNPVQNKVITAAIPTKTSDLTNDSGFLTQHQDISGKISAPANPATGQFLVYDGTAWTAQTLLTWQGDLRT